MAKKKVAVVMGSRRGPDSLEERIAKLSQELGKKGVAQAESLIENEDANVIRLAYNLLRQRSGQGPAKLGSRIDELLGFMSEAEAEAIRQKLLAAKSAKLSEARKSPL